MSVYIVRAHDDINFDKVTQEKEKELSQSKTFLLQIFINKYTVYLLKTCPGTMQTTKVHVYFAPPPNS